ncbi:hypothetical protein MYIN104542_05055 [Mycobacterium intermedium]
MYVVHGVSPYKRARSREVAAQLDAGVEPSGA